MCILLLFCFFKQKTAYEMRISDWSSDVCSSDLVIGSPIYQSRIWRNAEGRSLSAGHFASSATSLRGFVATSSGSSKATKRARHHPTSCSAILSIMARQRCLRSSSGISRARNMASDRSEEHTSELQSLMRNSYAVFCLKKKINKVYVHHTSKPYGLRRFLLRVTSRSN